MIKLTLFALEVPLCSLSLASFYLRGQWLDISETESNHTFRKMASTAFLSGEVQGRSLLVLLEKELGQREKTDYGDILWNVTESLDSPRTLSTVNSTFRRPGGMGLYTKAFSNIQKSMKSFSEVPTARWCHLELYKTHPSIHIVFSPFMTPTRGNHILVWARRELLSCLLGIKVWIYQRLRKSRIVLLLQLPKRQTA